jgi:hypothetical protein
MMGKGKRLRSEHKMEMMKKHFEQMQRQESIRRAFALTPIAQAVKMLCRQQELKK